MKLSTKARQIKPSLTRALFNKAKVYDDVIDLTLGDPDFSTPQAIKEAGIRAILENKTHYSMNAGLLEAREAIARHLYDVWGISCDANRNLAITVGGMEALYLALLCLVDSGSEVIIFAPYYANYVHMIEMCGGQAVIINAYDNGMAIDKKSLEDAMTSKTVAMIINSPSNPTGDVLSAADLKIIADLALKYDLAIISDEVYHTLLYDGVSHQSILQFESARDRTILVDSLSKEFSMTGWRIGYAYAPDPVAAAMIEFQENVAACAALPSQYALIRAYDETPDMSDMIRTFQLRRDVLCNELAEVEGITFVKPKGTFYLFVNISALHMGSEEFAMKLLEEKHVAVVPGVAYGKDYDTYIRIAFTKDVTIIEAAAKKIKAFIAECMENEAVRS